MKIVVITPHGSREEEINTVIKLFENGLETLHLRKPKYRTREMKEYIEQIPVQFHNRIIIHSHHLLARKYSLKGIHFTKAHFKKTFRNWWINTYLRFLKPDLLKTTSHTKLASLYDDDSKKIKFDYVFLSPIFDSLTGKYQSGFYEEGIRATLGKVSKKIIARGGVDGTRIEKIKELGFYGMALYSHIWESKKPVEDFVEILKRCRELSIAVD